MTLFACLSQNSTPKELGRSTRALSGVRVRRGRLAACTAGLLSAALCSACHHRSNTPQKPKRPEFGEITAYAQSTSELGPPVPSAAELPPPVVNAIRAVREQRLALAPPDLPSDAIAFDKERMLVLGADRALLLGLEHGNVLNDAPVAGPRAVTRSADGALLVLGQTALLRYEPGQTSPKTLPHVAFLPGSASFADLEDPGQLLVFYRQGNALFRYALKPSEDAPLPISEEHTLEGYTGALAMHRDGAFLYAAGTELRRYAPRGSRTAFALTAKVPKPWRVLPAARLDEAYVLGRAGDVARVRLAPGLAVVAHFQLPAGVFDARASETSLAFILLEQKTGEPRHWTLVVTDLEGQQRFSVRLPDDPAVSLDDDWAQVLTRSRNVYLSPFAPLVAAGGPDSVSVWNYAEGTLSFTR